MILTTNGYIDLNDVEIGAELVAYDVNTGAPIINTLLGKELFSNDDNKYYKINNEWTLNENQSIWYLRNNEVNVCHVKDLLIGDIVFNDSDQDVLITDIQEELENTWWRLSVSGDHSYIIDDLTLHNASRYWVGGGSSANWSATANTNWSATSGGSNNATVPTSADDVTFDGVGTNGNTNSTISATITILSLNITTGYTATMTHNAVLTIAGNWTMSNTHTIAGTSAITLESTSITITSNGQTWPNSLNIRYSIITLSGNFTCSGNSNIVIGNNQINKTASETWKSSGITNTGGNVSGTAEIILTGGTWSSTGGTIDNNLSFDGNVTVSGTVYYKTGILKYTSGTITTTSSTLNTVGNCTLNTNGITWNNVNITFSVITLTSNFTATGTTNSVTGTNQINKTASETWSTNGVSLNTGSLQGTSEIILTGGTWSSSGSLISNNLTLNGNVTISGIVYYSGGTLKYTSGTITTTGSTLSNVGGSGFTINTNGVTWNNVTLGAFAYTYTINSLLSISNTLTVGTAGATFAGTSGWTCATLLNAGTGSLTITLKDSNTYTITSLLDCYQSRVGSIVTFTSSSATIKSNLTLQNGASCKCLASFTRINAGAGRTINTFGGTITNCDNIRQFYDLSTVSFGI